MPPNAPLPTVLTIGHSQHTLEGFLALLASGQVNAVADVRSAPFSRRHPHFSREPLAAALRGGGVAYVFLGDALGGRPASRRLLTEGVADYERMAREPAFQEGLRRVLAGAAKHRIALMCSEADPVDCHRCLLVGRALRGEGAECRHILPDATQVTQEEIEMRLLAEAGMESEDLFAPREERLAAAYRRRARRVAYAETEPA